MFKKLTAILSAAILTVSMAAFASAEEGYTAETYQEAYQAYKVFYQETYVPAYRTYNTNLRNFANQVRHMDMETVEDYQRVKDFVDSLKAAHRAFFGDRVTPGTSRYDVPYMRDAMYAAEKEEDYYAAEVYCGRLVKLVEARMDFLGSISDKIAGFEANDSGSTTESAAPTTTTQPETTTTTQAPVSHAQVSFQYRATGGSVSDFQITIQNTGDEDFTDWRLTFVTEGITLTNVWANGGAYQLTAPDHQIRIRPLNKWQTGYTIPAGETLVLEGTITGNPAEGSITDVAINGMSVSASYGPLS